MYHQVRQDLIAAGDATRNIVENSTVQEQVIVQENPEFQVLERIQAQIAETITEVPQESVQQRTVGHILRVPVHQIQEQVIVQEIPELQVVERIQIAEVPRERVQQRTFGQIVRAPAPQTQEQVIV